MPSITTWNRLEPRPRSDDIKESLAARLRDPLWLLSRQWQFGEFQGEDAGSPAYVLVTSSSAAMSRWSAATSEGDLELPKAPLESVITREELDDTDSTLAVELGQTFVAFLAQSGVSNAEQAFRDAFPVRISASGVDPEAARFRRMVASRTIDGIALYRSALTSPGTVPAGVRLPDIDAAAIAHALRGFVEYVHNIYGEMDGRDPPSWDPARLRYEANVKVDASGPTFSATPDRHGTFDWYAFDLARGTVSTSASQVRSMMPMHAAFRGMPNARFWDFEDATTDFGDVRPDRRDLSRLMLIEFMLLHANDWFVIPFEQEVGTLVRIDNLSVHDVFGGATVIARAGSADSAELGRWSMFATTVNSNPPGLSDMLFSPAAAGAARQDGEILEEVRFLRDETANMVWAVEHTTASGIGTPRSGHEAALDDRPALPPAPGESRSLRYRIQTNVPCNWIPFLPVQIDSSGQVALERAGMLSGEEALSVVPSLPASRLLRPIALGDGAYQLREEEVPRTGVRLMRQPFLCRWVDGRTYLWWARGRSAGAGEGSSGLRFDITEYF